MNKLPPLICSSCGVLKHPEDELVTNDKLTPGLRIRINKDNLDVWGQNLSANLKLRFTVVSVNGENDVTVKNKSTGKTKNYYSLYCGNPTFCYDDCSCWTNFTIDI